MEQQSKPQSRSTKGSNKDRGAHVKRGEMRYEEVYSKCLISKHISIPITEIGKNIKQTIEAYVAHHFESKCNVEGYIKPNSSNVITFSSGVIKSSNVVFEVVFECLTCFPVEGMLIKCLAKNITKAGIRAEISDASSSSASPVVIFITRDHHNTMPYFSTIQEGDSITVRVIGQRFELNDKFVSVIAELIKPVSTNEVYNTKENPSKGKGYNGVKKPKLVID